MIKLKDIFYGFYIAIQFIILLCLLAFVAATAIPIVITCILFSYCNFEKVVSTTNDKPSVPPGDN